MLQIKTFVFFDLETTGLLDYSDEARITELAFTACSREHLTNGIKGQIPRVTSKLLLQINPMKPIRPDSTRITGLDNYNLEFTKKMDASTIDLLNCFLKQLSKPVCLVAHNGNGFDYIILKKQLAKLGCHLEADLLCVDSLDIFRQINQQSENATYSAIDELLNTDLRAVQNQNEKTPSKPRATASIVRDANEKPSAAKCLFDSPKPATSPSLSSIPSSSPSPSISTSQSKNNSTTKLRSFTRSPISYKLSHIYQRLHDCVPDVSHTAEADTRHLLLCAIAAKNEFVNLADDMATQFINFVQPRK